jgi:hypothetical protein
VSDALPEPRPDVQPPAVPDHVAAALRMRASDADREKVAGILRDAFAEGRLSPVEHDERLSQVYSAQTYGELVPVLHDLPLPKGAFTVPGVTDAVALVQPAAPVRAAGTGMVVDPSLAGQAQGPAVAIFSGAERKGRWVVPASFPAVAVFGGVELDFTQAVLSSQETSIQVFAMFGGIDITVPEGVIVRQETIGILGGTSTPPGDAPADAPVLRIQGIAILGGVDVHRPKVKKRKGDGKPSIES